MSKRKNRNKHRPESMTGAQSPTYLTFDFDQREIGLLYVALLEAPMHHLVQAGFKRGEVEKLLGRMSYINTQADTGVEVSLYD